jgi:hypothetical protein
MTETIDIDDLADAISAGIYGDDRMSRSTLNAATAALSQLVAEVERLRGERAAVVAWLRANTSGPYDFAEHIERGEHRGEE